MGYSGMKETLHIYTRVSTKVQNDDGTSIDTQIELGIRKADELGLNYKIWNEGGASSNYEDLLNRPVLLDLLNKVDKGEVKFLFVFNNDRLSRNDITAQTIRIALQRHDVILYTKDGKFDLANPSDKLFKTILDGIAQYDNALRAERSRMGKIQRVGQGYWYGSPPPFGYDIINKRLTINTEEGAWVKKIFRWVCEGKSIMFIKSELDKNGVQPRRKKGKFSLGSVARILKNTHYIGYYTWTDKKSAETITCECQPLEDDTTCHLAHKKLHEKSIRSNQQRKTTRFYLLRDLMWCEHCGGKIAGRIKPSSYEYLYYCTNKTRNWKNGTLSDDVKWKRGKVGDYGCEMVRSLSITLTDKFVCDKVVETIKNSALLKEQFTAHVLQSPLSTDTEIEHHVKQEKSKLVVLSKTIKKIQSSIADVETKHLLNSYDDGVYKQIIINLNNELQSTKNKMEQSRLKIEALKNQKTLCGWIGGVLKEVEEFEGFTEVKKREFLHDIIERIGVRLDKKTMEHILTISFKLPLVAGVIDNKSDGSTLVEGKSDTEIRIPITNRAGRKKSPHNQTTQQSLILPGFSDGQHCSHGV